jgi:hypothetical protein
MKIKENVRDFAFVCLSIGSGIIVALYIFVWILNILIGTL